MAREMPSKVPHDFQSSIELDCKSSSIMEPPTLEEMGSPLLEVSVQATLSLWSHSRDSKMLSFCPHCLERLQSGRIGVNLHVMVRFPANSSALHPPSYATDYNYSNLSMKKSLNECIFGSS